MSSCDPETSTICAVDVYYRDTGALSAAVTFGDWTDEKPQHEITVPIPQVAEYRPGQFYLRELPCILAVLEKLPCPPRTIVVDGYVWLRPDEPGLGLHLYETLGSRVPVIGVAKTSFDGSPHAVPVRRGDSKRPLYVTAAGMEDSAAAACVTAMHGEYRLPTLLKAVDMLCRS